MKPKASLTRTARSTRTERHSHVSGGRVATHPQEGVADAATGPETANPKIPVIKRDDTGTAVQIEKNLDALLPSLPRITGTGTFEVAVRLVDQVARTLADPKPSGLEAAAIQAISLLSEIAPQGLLEAQLAAQIIGVHESALRFLAAANREGQSSEGMDANIVRATRLMRLQLEQIEAMQKLKGLSGQQRVVVEHVNVLAGGQAIVGTIEAPKGNPGNGGGQ